MALKVSSDAIADCVLETFDKLPRKFKPRAIADGRREWVPLAGIVLSQDDEPTHLTCVALATGMKCLPQIRVPLSNGNVIHDWHAEVLAIRAFNRWILDGCRILVESGQEQDEWLEWRGRQQHDNGGTPFAIKDGVRIHMYCSEAPCGDASMELTMAAQDDPTPWAQQEQLPLSTIGEQNMLGRGHFDQLGIVRRKPARPDAPSTLSKSCSDKLALKQCTSLLCGIVSTIVSPGNAYLQSLVLPESQHVAESVERSWSTNGRMRSLVDNNVQERWRAMGYKFHPFEVRSTRREFKFSRRQLGTSDHTGALLPSNLSALYTSHKQEVLINGVLQGRKPLDGVRAASCVARRSMWAAVVRVASVAGLQGILRGGSTYEAFKKATAGPREQIKQDTKYLALAGWQSNVGDGDWRLDEIAGAS